MILKDATHNIHAAVLAYAADVVTVVGSDGHIRYENEAVKSVLGYEYQERIGLQFAQFVHPDYLHLCDRILSPDSLHATAPIVLKMLHADGAWRYMELSCSGF